MNSFYVFIEGDHLIKHFFWHQINCVIINPPCPNRAVKPGLNWPRSYRGIGGSPSCVTDSSQGRYAPLLTDKSALHSDTDCFITAVKDLISTEVTKKSSWKVSTIANREKLPTSRPQGPHGVQDPHLEIQCRLFQCTLFSHYLIQICN